MRRFVIKPDTGKVFERVEPIDDRGLRCTDLVERAAWGVTYPSCTWIKGIFVSEGQLRELIDLPPSGDE